VKPGGMTSTLFSLLGEMKRLFACRVDLPGDDKPAHCGREDGGRTQPGQFLDQQGAEPLEAGMFWQTCAHWKKSRYAGRSAGEVPLQQRFCTQANIRDLLLNASMRKSWGIRWGL